MSIPNKKTQRKKNGTRTWAEVRSSQLLRSIKYGCSLVKGQSRTSHIPGIIPGARCGTAESENRYTEYQVPGIYYELLL